MSYKIEQYSETDAPFSDLQIEYEKLTKNDISAYEKKRKMDLMDFVTHNGFLLLVYILISMFILVIIDCFLPNKFMKTSEYISTLIDFGKYISTTLLGFLFANKNNKNE